MSPKFHDRFTVEIDADEAKRRFVNRVWNEVLNKLDDFKHEDLKRKVLSGMGEHYWFGRPLEHLIQSSYSKTLDAFKALYRNVGSSDKRELDSLIECLLRESEVDLGIRWENGNFVKSGAELLDTALVNDVLRWLGDQRYQNVLEPYEKGLKHFLEVDRRPEVLADVITDMYEALEALVGIITGKPKPELSRDSELFIKKVKVSKAYKKLLKEYIEYANAFRHAASPHTAKPSLTIPEVESFIYLTGIFIRLAITVPTTT